MIEEKARKGTRMQLMMKNGRRDKTSRDAQVSQLHHQFALQ
jgi:hypothetical protein